MVYIMQKEQQDALQAASLHREKAVSFMECSLTEQIKHIINLILTEKDTKRQPGIIQVPIHLYLTPGQRVIRKLFPENGVRKMRVLQAGMQMEIR